MYKFTGGFINTLQPFNNDIYNKKLIMTKEFLELIKNLVSDLQEIHDTTDEIYKKNRCTKKTWNQWWYGYFRSLFIHVCALR